MWIILVILSVFTSASDESFKNTMEGWQKISKVNYNSPRAIEKTALIKSISSPYLKKPIDVALNLAPKATDLVIMIPGTFGGYDSPELVRLGTLLHERGYNILRVPNPQSRYVVKLQPTFVGLNFEGEAEFYKNIIEQIRAEYPFHKLHIIGTS